MIKYLVIAILFIQSTLVLGQVPIDLSNYTESKLIGENCLITDGALSDSLKVFNNQVEWVTVDNSIVPLGVPNKGKWIKLKVKNLDYDSKQYVLEVNLPTLDSLVSFIVVDGTVVQRMGEYESSPFDERVVSHQTYLVEIPEHLSEVDIFLYASSVEQVNLPITIASYGDQSVNAATRDLNFGIYLGIILAMFFYNVFILYSTKDVSYVYYVIYIGFVGMVQVALQGYGFKYLWPSFPNWQQISLNFLNLGTAVFAFLFFQSFVRLKTILPKWRWPFYLILAIYVLQFFMAVFGYGVEAYSLMNISALLLSFIFIFASALAIYKKSRQAIFFLIGWFAFLASIIIFVLKDVGVVPYNLFTANILQIGSGLEVLLLSFGLADRISTLRRDRNRSQQRALEISLENERIIREQNRMLEEKVTERTSELNQALLDVKSAQSKMVEQEKMASLGQLTAGIAHEINNPINFVSANISPLKRDLNDVFELIDHYDQITDGDTFDEQKAKVESFKEEIELDYVREEIDQLISGIQDGAMRTAEIVRGLKLFSRTDERDLKQVDIVEGIESTLTLLKNAMVGSVEVHREYEELPRIECFGGKMNQVFMNILSNSIQAIQEKPGQQGNITIVTKNLEDEICMQFIDDALGMPPEVIKKIYDPFFTTKPVGTGTGLGLAIAKGIIDSHSGKIEVESKVGEGTTFTISLPKTQPQPNE